MSAPIIKAVIFDLDGVIIDSNPEIEKFWHRWAARENVALTDELVRMHIHGRKGTETIQVLFPHVTEATKQAIRHAADALNNEINPAAITGVVSFIQFLRKQKITTGVVTSSHKSRMVQMLQKHGLEQSFISFVTAHDVTKGKPDPEPYRKMAEQLNLSPAQCLVFEDAVSGIRSAVAAGMHAIGIGNAAAEKGLLAEGAVLVIPDFTHLRLSETSLGLPNGFSFQWG
ncbi:MAG: HAD family phosphatase [Sediminibacterium magnilacihabitans]|jgi:sugar-phosphatase|nr:HAD family phosphatase [Sediminibacterium magnilacihabitans]PQV59733.1 sugar-phosphatase [Sediminibacterium magnilacihabitans]